MSIAAATVPFLYFDAREKDSKTFALQAKAAQAEALKQYYSKVLDMCVDVTTVNATIATASDSVARHRAVQDFRRLYYGPTIIIENTELGRAMADFKECLQSSCGAAGQADEKNDLLRRSLNVARSCSHEITHGLNVGGLAEAPSTLGAVVQ